MVRKQSGLDIVIVIVFVFVMKRMEEKKMKRKERCYHVGLDFNDLKITFM